MYICRLFAVDITKRSYLKKMPSICRRFLFNLPSILPSMFFCLLHLKQTNRHLPVTCFWIVLLAAQALFLKVLMVLTILPFFSHYTSHNSNLWEIFQVMNMESSADDTVDSSSSSSPRKPTYVFLTDSERYFTIFNYLL